MPDIYSNQRFVGTRIRSLPAAVNSDEPVRKAEFDAGGGGGEDGASAYEIAVDNGFVGTEVEWLASLHGEDGEDGTDGTNGTNGTNGSDGRSAYQVALDNGFVGTEAEWIDSLQGAEGEQGDTGPQGLSFFQRRVQTVTGASGSVSCDWSDYDEIRISMVGNVTLTFTGPPADGQGCTLKLIQDATGGRTVTLPGSVRFSTDITGYVATVTGNRADRIGFIHDAGASTYDFVSLIKGFIV